MTLFLSLVACQSSQLIPKTPSEVSQLMLGQLGEKRKMLDTGFEVKGSPALTERLSIKVTQKPHTSSSHNALKRGMKNMRQVVPTDSLLPSHFYQLELIDDIGYTTALARDDNNQLDNYLQGTKDARVVTQLLYQGDLLMMEPEASVFIQTSSKTGRLEMVTQGGMPIALSEGVIFDMKLSYLCWGKTERGRIAILDLVEEGKGCSGKLSRKRKKLTKEKNLYDY